MRNDGGETDGCWKRVRYRLLHRGNDDAVAVAVVVGDDDDGDERNDDGDDDLRRRRCHLPTPMRMA